MSNDFSSMTTTVLDVIFTEERERQKLCLKSLIEANHLQGGNEFAFYFAGKRFTQIHKSNLYLLKHIDIKKIHKDLESETENYYNLQTKMELDEKKIQQIFYLTLKKAGSMQEVRDVLPEFIAKDIFNTRELIRINKEGFLQIESPMHYDQFQKAVEIALYYAANKLVYT